MRHKIRLIGCSTLLFLSFIFLLVLSCTERPENIWDNPLDPMNSEMTTDPYHLTAQIASGGIQLSWSAVTSLPIAGYAVHRQVWMRTDLHASPSLIILLLPIRIL